MVMNWGSHKTGSEHRRIPVAASSHAALRWGSMLDRRSDQCREEPGQHSSTGHCGPRSRRDTVPLGEDTYCDIGKKALPNVGNAVVIAQLAARA